MVTKSVMHWVVVYIKDCPFQPHKVVYSFPFKGAFKKSSVAITAFVESLRVRIKKFGKLLGRCSNPEGALSPVRVR
jgi:hypothetical protein